MKEDLTSIATLAKATLREPCSVSLHDPAIMLRSFNPSLADVAEPRPVDSACLAAVRSTSSASGLNCLHEAISSASIQFRPFGLSRRALARTLAHMEAHLMDKGSLDDLVNAAGLSRSHFCRMFRVTTGHSPMDYWLRMKIERAKVMLLLADQRILDVAYSLGFFDQSHFSRTFRRMTGLSPAQFARMAETTWTSS